jgi:hypothetical protein
MVGETGHLEGSQRRRRVSITRETLSIDSNNRVLFLDRHILRAYLLGAHKRDVLLVDLVLNGEVIDEGAEVVEKPLQIVLLLKFGR